MPDSRVFYENSHENRCEQKLIYFLEWMLMNESGGRWALDSFVLPVVIDVEIGGLDERRQPVVAKRPWMDLQSPAVWGFLNK
ncbi:hypothetical protein ACOTH1_22265 [Achromobacter ruhlandii]|uniref:hypothetical protein n=1 Tax=Achromobacter ruhlandii TaxID=72557 RepID=UPI00289FD440|nr:hypothetical protein [Achromobacter ruhlandii]